MITPPDQPRSTILETVERYYAERLAQFGPTPRGADWNSADSQALRFDRLLVALEDAGDDAETSLVDYGCGYGALLDVLRSRGRRLWYHGFDISGAMIEAARTRHAGDSRATLTTELSAVPRSHYTLASGIFNVKLGHAIERWHEYVMETLVAIDALTTRAFAFNMLSTYSDADRRRDDLFYMDPLSMFDSCKRRFSTRVALLHDYPLYEFTIIVRK
jgi:SAM-dependent methyltransferase